MGTFNLDQTFIREYERTWNYLYQQDTSFLRTTVRNEPQNAEKKYWTFIAPTQGIKNRARHCDSPDIPTQHERRECKMDTWTWSELVEDMDIIKTLSDPSSAYLKNAVSAAHRFYDEEILAGLGAIAKGGKDGDTSINRYDVGECTMIDGAGTVVTAGSDFGNATSTGLTLTKLATIGKVMDNNNVPATDRHLVANVDQKWMLLGSARATSADFASISAISALTQGQIPNNYYMGFYFHWLPSDRFTTNAAHTSYPAYECYAYHRDSVILTTGMEMKTRLTEESKSNYAIRVFAEKMNGSTRLQGKGVVPICLLKAPAIDFSATTNP